MHGDCQGRDHQRQRALAVEEQPNADQADREREHPRVEVALERVGRRFRNPVAQRQRHRQAAIAQGDRNRDRPTSATPAVNVAIVQA